MFDNPVFSLRQLPQVQTSRRCSFEETSPGQLANARTRVPMSYEDPCYERGAMLGYDAAAHGEAIKAVTDVLKATFKMR
ncbi:MAG: hypothetical protein H7Y19_09460 [Luteimonas sp.]|nr:hypothetical protein [Luteimonas sp.]